MMSFIAKFQANSFLKLGADQGWMPLVSSVRFRYHKDKIERGPLHRLGYKDKILTHGLLPRDETFKKLPMKTFQPPNRWSQKEALYGRNDYIDILGESNLRPTDVCYKVPTWLRGFKGNEFQMLIRRKKVMGENLKEFHPNRYTDMCRRIRYLYYILNYKKKDYFSKKA